MENRKFKVGDWVYDGLTDDEPYKIVGLFQCDGRIYYLLNWPNDYEPGLSYEAFLKNKGTIEVIQFDGLAILSGDNRLRSSWEDIADTKIAREIYPDAEDLGNGILRVHYVQR